MTMTITAPLASQHGGGARSAETGVRWGTSYMPPSATCMTFPLLACGRVVQGGTR